MQNSHHATLPDLLPCGKRRAHRTAIFQRKLELAYACVRDGCRRKDIRGLLSDTMEAILYIFKKHLCDLIQQLTIDLRYMSVQIHVD